MRWWPILAAVALLVGCDRGGAHGEGSRRISNEVRVPDAADPDRPMPPGTRERVGHIGDWRGTRAAVVLGEHLYSVEGTDARLWKTPLQTGSWIAIGQPDFARTTHLVATRDALYSVEDNGGLYRIDPASGTWQGVGQPGDWKGTRLAAVIADHLYSIETGSPALWRTTLATGDWVRVGQDDHGSVVLLVATAAALVAISAAGDVWRIDPATGARTTIGAAGVAAGARLAAVIGDRLYTIERDGSLRTIDLATGASASVGPDFGGVSILVASASRLYAIERDGGLYRIWP